MTSWNACGNMRRARRLTPIQRSIPFSADLLLNENDYTCRDLHAESPPVIDKNHPGTHIPASLVARIKYTVSADMTTTLGRIRKFVPRAVLSEQGQCTTKRFRWLPQHDNKDDSISTMPWVSRPCCKIPGQTPGPLVLHHHRHRV